MGISGIITFTLLIWTESFAAAQWIEIFYAAYITQEVAYFAYIYAKVSREHYLAVTAHTRSALLFGRCISGVLAQLLIHYNLMNIRQLNYITFGAQISATIFAFFLPNVNQSIYFHRHRSYSGRENTDNNNHLELNSNENRDKNICSSNCNDAFKLMWKQFKCAYTNRQVVLWSVWYACGLCGYLQIISYVQLLWISIDNRPEVIRILYFTFITFFVILCNE